MSHMFIVMKYRKPRAKKAKVSDAVKKYVKKVVKNEPELKQAAIAYGTSVVSTTVGTRYYMCTGNGTTVLGQGAGDYQRLASKIKIHEINANISLQLTGAAFSDVCRVIVFREKQPEGVALNSAEFMYDNTAGHGTISPYNQKYKHRFEIFYDRVHKLVNQSGTVATPAETINVKVHKRFKQPKITTYYTASTGGGVTSIEQGSIIIYLLSELGNTTANVVYTNILFTDA